jgi:branched-chain amino acid transport system ATP-binding protein
MSGRRIGEVILDLTDVSLSFGGVKALQNISFNVREHEIRAIIGPNGAGKSSMLNVINGVYTPQQGSITFHGKVRGHMDPHDAAALGIGRTFQSLALFKGMSVLDNIMTGRNLRMRTGLLSQAIHLGFARREELRHREFVEHIIDFLEIQAYRKTSVGRLPYGLQKRVDLGRALAGHVPLRARRQRRVRDDHRADRARHGRRDGHLGPRGRARLWQEDRRRHAG